MSLPKPYYEQDGITIYHADCRDILPLLEPGSVDLVLTDPPYGIAYSNHGRSNSRLDIKGDESMVVGGHAIAWCAENELATVAFSDPMKPWPGNWRQHLVWDKGPAVGGGGDIPTCWKQSWESVQVARTGRLNGPRDEGVLRFHVGPIKPYHPAEKPIALIKYLIGKTTDCGDVIFDPFMGSGTTLRAAKDLGRRAIGIELEERYCEIAAKRLQQSVLPMFAEAAS